jgi:hypothetical protein
VEATMRIAFTLIVFALVAARSEGYRIGRVRRSLPSGLSSGFNMAFGGLELRMAPGDFIDVEIDSGSLPDEDEAGRGRAGSSLFRPNEDDGSNSDEEQSGIIGGITSAIGSGLSKVFGGGDKKSLAMQKKKKERKNEMDTAIDNIFDEVGAKGIAGGIMKAAAKAAGGMISDMAADYASDFGEIQELVVEAVENDAKAKFLVGDSIRTGAPFQSSSYSSSINGVATKRMSYVMPVAGTKGQAQAEVEASSREDGSVTIDALSISNGVSRTTIVSPGGRGGPSKGGGSRGGGGGGGGGDVIDVEVL